MSDEQDVRPWSARKPQSFIISALLVLVAIGLVWQGVNYVRSGTGGLVPYFILLGGPALAVYYVWYLTIRRFGSDSASPPD